MSFSGDKKLVPYGGPSRSLARSQNIKTNKTWYPKTHEIEQNNVIRISKMKVVDETDFLITL